MSDAAAGVPEGPCSRRREPAAKARRAALEIRDTVANMSLQGDYVPSTASWVRDQVAEYEASGGTQANTLRDTGIPIVVVTMRGAKSSKIRKIAVMRIEHDGE